MKWYIVCDMDGWLDKVSLFFSIVILLISDSSKQRF